MSHTTEILTAVLKLVAKTTGDVSLALVARRLSRAQVVAWKRALEQALTELEKF